MFPYFIMHYCVFVLIPPAQDIEQAVADALRPFDEALEVAPFRVHLNRDEVCRIATRYKIDPANLHELAERLPDWTGRQGGVDRDGLYYVSTCNPDGYWDWYEIGGRWSRYIPLARDNAIQAARLARYRNLANCLPYYVLTPEGKWIEHQRIYLTSDWKKTHYHKMKKHDWLRLVRQTLLRWPKHRAACVDIHA